jgi:glycosyltransferase involved in cell wall biosynthesis
MPLHSHPIDPIVMDQPPEIRFDVVMTGASGRDWEMFLAVCRAMPDLRFAAVTSTDQIAAMDDCLNLTKFQPLAFDDYCRTIRASKVSLLLLRDAYGATGQRDILTIGELGRPVVANRVESLSYYAGEDESVRFVESSDLAATCVAIRELIEQPDLRETLGRALQRRVLEHHTAQAVAQRWAQVLAPMHLAGKPTS